MTIGATRQRQLAQLDAAIAHALKQLPSEIAQQAQQGTGAGGDDSQEAAEGEASKPAHSLEVRVLLSRVSASVLLAMSTAFQLFIYC